jgi:predicted membrane metal-binding protein
LPPTLIAAPRATAPYETQVSFFFLIGRFFVVIFVAFLVHLREFERFGGDDFELSAAFIADYDVSFFHFVGVEIENALAFLTDWHTALLSRSIKKFVMTAAKMRLG